MAFAIFRSITATFSLVTPHRPVALYPAPVRRDCLQLSRLITRCTCPAEGARDQGPGTQDAPDLRARRAQDRNQGRHSSRKQEELHHPPGQQHRKSTRLAHTLRGTGPKAQSHHQRRGTRLFLFVRESCPSSTSRRWPTLSKKMGQVREFDARRDVDENLNRTLRSFPASSLSGTFFPPFFRR